MAPFFFPARMAVRFIHIDLLEDVAHTQLGLPYIEHR